MPNQNPNGTTLVIGATGKTGRRVADRLERRGVAVRRVSRSSPIVFDWDDPTTWEPALDGVDAIYVTYSPDLAVPAAVPAVRELAGLAAERQVPRLVLLSGRNEAEAQRCERIVQDANPAWSVVRASWFSQNFSEGFLVDMVRAGTVALPAGAVREPFVDVDDIADVAVAALTEPGHAGRIYEVTGPRAWSFPEAVDEIARATGRPLRYEQIPVEAFVDGMKAQGVPGPYVDLVRFLFETVLDGRNEATVSGVEDALGRPARDFADYVAATARTGVWNASAPTGAAPA